MFFVLLDREIAALSQFSLAPLLVIDNPYCAAFHETKSALYSSVFFSVKRIQGPSLGFIFFRFGNLMSGKVWKEVELQFLSATVLILMTWFGTITEPKTLYAYDCYSWNLYFFDLHKAKNTICNKIDKRKILSLILELVKNLLSLLTLYACWQPCNFSLSLYRRLNKAGEDFQNQHLYRKSKSFLSIYDFRINFLVAVVWFFN